MKVSITERKKGQVTIIDMVGNLTIGQGDVALREKVNELLDAGRRLFIFNMKEIPFMDSAGLGETVTVLGRHQYRITGAEGVELVRLQLGVSAVGLVDHRHHGDTEVAQVGGEILVLRHEIVVASLKRQREQHRHAAPRRFCEEIAQGRATPRRTWLWDLRGCMC